MKTCLEWWGACSFFAMVVFYGCDRSQITVSKTPPKAETTIPNPTLPPGDAVAATISSGSELKLNVRIDGFVNEKGVCRVAVYLGKAHFNDLEYAMAKESIAIVDAKAEVLLALEIPAGTDGPSIAVCAYHDENDNARLDKNSFGIPIERYGFSANPKRGFGPPKYSEAAIELDTAKLTNQLDIPITIK